MLLYPFLALAIPFPGTFIIIGNANNGRNPPSCHFSVLVTLFPVIAFINEEAIDAMNEAAIRVIIAPRNPHSYFFISCFTGSITPSISRSDFSSDSTILIISSIS